jgi:CBS domain-containing protein
MKTIIVKDLMVPLDEYATVDEDASLFEAVSALEIAQEHFDSKKYRHRAVLVISKTGVVKGKISQLDALRALEPKYSEFSSKGAGAMGFSKKFILSMMDGYDLWNKPMRDLCKKAMRIKARDIMYAPEEGEYVEEKATLDQAIHQLVIGRHQSLLVTGKNAIVGILRLTDVFTAVFQAMKACNVDAGGKAG